jgi:hypothetical protein
MNSKIFDRFPTWMALIGLSVSASIYLLGGLILSHFGILAGIGYLAFCAFVELAVLRGSCAHCFYYGKVCGLGKGRLCSLMVKRGDPHRFTEREVTFRDVIPEMLVPILPLVGGLIVLLRRFDWVDLAAILLILLLASFGNGFVRGALACRYCAQRELGCPAQKLFNQQHV